MKQKNHCMQLLTKGYRMNWLQQKEYSEWRAKLKALAQGNLGLRAGGPFLPFLVTAAMAFKLYCR